jgi:hypothetical protein
VDWKKKVSAVGRKQRPWPRRNASRAVERKKIKKIKRKKKAVLLVEIKDFGLEETPGGLLTKKYILNNKGKKSGGQWALSKIYFKQQRKKISGHWPPEWSMATGEMTGEMAS